MQQRVGTAVPTSHNLGQSLRWPATVIVVTGSFYNPAEINNPKALWRGGNRRKSPMLTARGKNLIGCYGVFVWYSNWYAHWKCKWNGSCVDTKSFKAVVQYNYSQGHFFLLPHTLSHIKKSHQKPRWLQLKSRSWPAIKLCASMMMLMCGNDGCYKVQKLSFDFKGFLQELWTFKGSSPWPHAFPLNGL